MNQTATTQIIPIQEVSDIELAFGGNVDKLMPAYDSIPQEFKRGSTKWNKVFSQWFFSGLTGARWTPKEGVDKGKALRHVAAIMASFSPKHEHKEAACAFLMSQWFEDVKY